VLFGLVWLPFGICAIEFRKEMIWRPDLPGSESGSGGLVDPPFTKPGASCSKFSHLEYFLKKMKKYSSGVKYFDQNKKKYFKVWSTFFEKAKSTTVGWSTFSKK